jgi:ketosteroid isomerase-like protein
VSRRAAARTALALVLLCAASRAAAQAPPPEAAVRGLDSLWARMYATHDTVAARRLYAPELVFTSASGRQKDLDAELADVRPQAGLAMEFFRSTPTQVRVHDATAVVTGIAEWRFTLNGQVRDVRRTYTATYARGGPLGWRIVAVHMGSAP